MPLRLAPTWEDDPQLSIAYWNHLCGDGCGTWVPNHLQRCAAHT